MTNRFWFVAAEFLLDWRSIRLAYLVRDRRLSRRFICAFSTLSLLITITGCAGVLSASGPSERAITSGANETDSTYTLIDLTASTIGPYLRKPEVEPKANVSTIGASPIKLVPGDVVKVLISDNVLEGGVFAPLARGGTVFERLRVEADGHISLPYVGRRLVSGLTLPELETVLRSSLKGVTTDVQVYVELIGDLSGSVLVAGAVKAPGRFSALEGPMTLLDAINMAGGPVLEPHLVNVTLRTGSTVATYPYQFLLSGNNLPVPPHSEVVVERARKRFIAMGAVTTPGLHDLPSENPSLLESIASVGGLSERAADPTGVFVFRVRESGEGDSAPEVIRLNMADPAAIFLARRFLVEPEDAIYVTNASVYEWQKIISPIVQVLILGRTLNNGF